jgi:hypothetical protein
MEKKRIVPVAEEERPELAAAIRGLKARAKECGKFGQILFNADRRPELSRSSDLRGISISLLCGATELGSHRRRPDRLHDIIHGGKKLRLPLIWRWQRSLLLCNLA